MQWFATALLARSTGFAMLTSSDWNTADKQ
jgi:hypothetical protein